MSKIAFQFGGFTIYWYGVFLALAFTAGMWTASRRAPRSNIAPDRVLDLAPWLVLGTIVGARLMYVLTYWSEFAQAPFTEVFMIRKGGLVFNGGFLGATLACVLYIRARRLPLWGLADVLAPSIALGYGIGRFGCLMNGCCFGGPCAAPWGIQYPRDHVSHPAHVHPTQIYDALLSFALYAGLAWLYRKKRFDGQVFAAYLILYPGLRGIVECFRGDYGSRFLGVFTPAHLFGALIVTAGFILWNRLSARAGRQAGH